MARQTCCGAASARRWRRRRCRSSPRAARASRSSSCARSRPTTTASTGCAPSTTTSGATACAGPRRTARSGWARRSGPRSSPNHLAALCITRSRRPPATCGASSTSGSGAPGPFTFAQPVTLRAVAQQLWLLRHGEAVPHDSKPDPERELTARGERQSAAAGAAMARLGLEFAAVYTSPKVRALHTARLACAALNAEPEEEDVLADGFERADALELLGRHEADARVLVVGHEPSFSQVVHDLTGGRVDVKKGGIVAVRVQGGRGELIAMLRPRELESLAVSG